MAASRFAAQTEFDFYIFYQLLTNILQNSKTKGFSYPENYEPFVHRFDTGLNNSALNLNTRIVSDLNFEPVTAKKSKVSLL